MQIFRTTVLAGAAALALGVSGAAMAQTAHSHVMTVRVPGGGIAEIRYTGDVPPQVSFGEMPAAFAGWVPAASFFGGQSPFAMLDRISAEMDRQAASMFRQAAALDAEAQSGQLTDAAMRGFPAGTQGFSYVSTMSSNGVCTRSVEITSQGNGAAPRVVSHNSGNCGPAAATGGTPAYLPAAPAPTVAPSHQPDLLWTKAEPRRSYAGMVRKVATRRADQPR